MLAIKWSMVSTQTDSQKFKSFKDQKKQLEQKKYIETKCQSMRFQATDKNLELKNKQMEEFYNIFNRF